MRRLPQVAVATFAVVGLPVIAVTLLSASGLVTSMVALMAVSVALSLAASYLGTAIWVTRKHSGDMLFADLMIWGWLRRWFLERRLASAVRLLGLRNSDVRPLGEPGIGRSPGSDADASPAPDACTPEELSTSRKVRRLKQLAAGLEARHPDTHGHSHRVARHAEAIAKGMGLEHDEVMRIRTAATVHDVGKLYVPSEILNKPGKLTDEEFAAVKKHAEIGARMVAGLDDLKLVRIVRHHHERLDGAGYPDGLVGTQIPLGARIIAVADTFDAITSTRPYRKALPHKEGLAVLADEAGTQLDIDAVRAFRRYYGGHRPVALWAALIGGVRQLLATLVAQVKLGGAVTAVALSAFAAGEVESQLPRGNGQPPTAQGSGVAAAALPGDSAASPERRPSAGSGNGGQGSDGLVVGPGGSADTGSSETTPTVVPGSTEDSDGSTQGAQPAGSETSAGSGADSSDDPGGGSELPGDVVANTGDSASQVVSGVTEPVSSTVGAVVGTVDSTVKKTVEATIPKEVSVPPLLPGGPPIKVGGG
jgi:HD-GYP domain-containing protein (c-di-GMP phosphodiesterase class II)